MTSDRRHRRLSVRLLVVLCLTVLAAVSGCGSDGYSAARDQSVPRGDIELTNVATQKSTDLQAALDVGGHKPVLAWFWAPYCPTCRAEAPELDRFMAEHGAEVSMVGIGTLNDMDRAKDFLADTGVSHFPLLWEPSGEGWATFGVTAQPYLILIDRGKEIERWPGGASPAQIQQSLDKLR